jgi:ribosomal protein L16/L10AE
MGKGKGALDKMMFYVKSGQIIFEVQLKRNALQNEIIAINMLKQCQYRLPILTKVFLSN